MDPLPLPPPDLEEVPPALVGGWVVVGHPTVPVTPTTPHSLPVCHPLPFGTVERGREGEVLCLADFPQTPQVVPQEIACVVNPLLVVVGLLPLPPFAFYPYSPFPPSLTPTPGGFGRCGLGPQKRGRGTHYPHCCLLPGCVLAACLTLPYPTLFVDDGDGWKKFDC